MTVFTTQEQQQIDRANAEEKQPVMFVHGLWLLASSWDNWRTLFENRATRPLRRVGPMTRRPSHRRMTTRRSLPTSASSR